MSAEANRILAAIRHTDSCRDDDGDDCECGARGARAAVERMEAELARVQRMPTMKWAHVTAQIMQRLAKIAREGWQGDAQAMLEVLDQGKTYVSKLEADLAQAREENIFPPGSKSLTSHISVHRQEEASECATILDNMAAGSKLHAAERELLMTAARKLRSKARYACDECGEAPGMCEHERKVLPEEMMGFTGMNVRAYTEEEVAPLREALEWALTHVRLHGDPEEFARAYNEAHATLKKAGA
jgi:hypothetical protein